MSVKRCIGCRVEADTITDAELQDIQPRDIHGVIVHLEHHRLVTNRLFYLGARARRAHADGDVLAALLTAATAAPDHKEPFVYVTALHFHPELWATIEVSRDMQVAIAVAAVSLAKWGVLRLVYAPFMATQTLLLQNLSVPYYVPFTVLRSLLAFMELPRVDSVAQFQVAVHQATPQFLEAISPYVADFPSVSTSGNLARLMAHARHGAVKGLRVQQPLISYRLHECHDASLHPVLTASHAPALVVRRWRPQLHHLVGFDTRPVAAVLLACRRPTAMTALRLTEALVDAQRPLPLPAAPAHT